MLRLRVVTQHTTSSAAAAAASTSAAAPVIIVGGGLNGIGAARRLRAEGLGVVVLERQAEIGGIWTEFANDSSRSQNHEAAYRLNGTPLRSLSLSRCLSLSLLSLSLSLTLSDSL